MLLTLAATFAAVWQITHPLALPCWTVACLPLIGWYGVRVVATLALRGDRWPTRPHRAVMWGVTPMCVVVIATSYATHLPARMRFSMGRAELEGEAQRLLAMTPAELAAAYPDDPVDPNAAYFTLWTQRTLGTYEVPRIDVNRARGWVYFCSSGGGLALRPLGLVYMADPIDFAYDAWRVNYLPEHWALFMRE